MMVRTAELTEAVGDALWAPSVHNTQPWRWRVGPDSVELYADWERHLAMTDPDRRDVFLSCGAALHHLEVALAARGLGVQVDRMPDPEDVGHLATVTVRPWPPDQADAALYPAIARRRTDRRRMSHRPVPPAELEALAEQAGRKGAELIAMTGPMRARLDEAISEAARRQHRAPGYVSELQLWTQRYAGAQDGIPPANLTPPPVGMAGPSPLRRFPGGRLAQPQQPPGHGPADDAAVLLVLATPGDTPLDRLRAGEALSAVLLEATRRGLATTPLSQAVEVDATRHAIQQDVVRVPEQPQIVLRVGWPATGAAELPRTPRRDVRAVLLA